MVTETIKVSSTTPQQLGEEVIISVRHLSKMYRLYDAPHQRLKQSLFWRFGKSYGRIYWALRDVSFEIRRGETFGIIGKNGAGKSTLLQILAGLLMPTEGEVRIKGKVAALLELGSGFNPEFTGRENVYINGAIMGIPRSEMERRIQNIIEFADIGDFIDQPVKLYSNGMRMRLAFAVATHVDADILLIDEVLAVGDIFFRQKCYEWLENLKKKKVTIIIVSHSLQEVEQFCHRALLLDKGRVVFMGHPDEAVRRFYYLQQGVIEPTLVEENSQVERPEVKKIEEKEFWPDVAAFLDIRHVNQITDGWARCTGVAVCDVSGQPCLRFCQGETASFFYEFEVLKDIEIPIGGMLIRNDKGLIVHGKNTIQHKVKPPSRVRRGSRLRFRQDIQLNLGIGEYTFQIELSTMRKKDYDRRHMLPHPEIYQFIQRLCSVSRLGPFSIMMRQRWETEQLTHHGIADLPGSAYLWVLPGD